MDKIEWLNARLEDVTSTEIAALFGVSPYTTAFELWHRKKNKTIVELPSTERLKWGLRLEGSIAEGIAEDQGWVIKRMMEYLRIPELRMGASFDFDVQIQDPKDVLSFIPAILEIKNVDALQFRDGWIVEEDNIEAPLHIETQLQHQLAVSNRKLGFIGALIGGNKVVLLRRERNENVVAAIKEKVAAFWKSIEANQPPNPDFIRDADFISDLYQSSTRGKIIAADEKLIELAKKYKKHGDDAAEAKEKQLGVKAEILTLINDAEKVKHDFFTISAGTTAETTVQSYVRKAYRDFRINWKKEKNGT